MQSNSLLNLCWLFRRTLSVVITALVFISTAAAGPTVEVWAADQADTVPGVGGGLIYIWDASDLSKNASKAEPEIIDLEEAANAAADVLATAGCDPIGKRAHMLLANHSNSHVVLAHTASESLYFINVEQRAITGCVPQDAHYAIGDPGESMVIAGDIGEEVLIKVQTDYATETYSIVETFSTAPFAGALGTDRPGPVCGEFTADGRFNYTTIQGGGLLVVDVGSADATTPMSVAKVYPASTVPGIGCGALRLGDKMLTTGESGAGGGPDFLYVFDTSGASDGIFPDPVQIELPGDDVHGLVICEAKRGNMHKQFAVASMRVSNDVNAVDLSTHTVVKTKSMARGFSPDPKPDVADNVGRDMFIALRGPQPLTAISGLPNADRTPGVAVLRLNNACRGFGFGKKDIAPMVANPNTVVVEGREVSAADPHGLDVVVRNGE